jgi:hypothetical protein
MHLFVKIDVYALKVFNFLFEITSGFFYSAACPDDWWSTFFHLARLSVPVLSFTKIFLHFLPRDGQISCPNSRVCLPRDGQISCPNSRVCLPRDGQISCPNSRVCQKYD